MTKDTPQPSAAAEALIKELFAGNKIVDEEAFNHAVQGLSAADRQMLQDLRDAAFEYEELDDETLAQALGRAKKRPKTQPNNG